MLDCSIISYQNNDVNSDNIVFWNNFRITLLTDKIIRVEKSERKIFTDNLTKTFINRNTPKVQFTQKIEKNTLYITTKSAIFAVKNNLSIKVSFDGGKTFVKEKGNLFGTRRTLDMCISKVKLEKGLLSKSGVTIFDDSKTPVFVNGKLENREVKEKDLYIFASLDYLSIIKDFYLISGITPMLPRYAFGNFWSRYYPYSEDEYIAVMQKFHDKKIPFSVAVVDMDWHYVNLKKDFPKLYSDFPNYFERSPLGWTGYTFNKKLFPDHKRFLNTLHKMGLHTTINVHPAQGVLPHEDAYNVMIEKCHTLDNGVIPFNFEDDDFINCYFEFLHKPLEEEGVDFWWIDWQQGKKTKYCGIDPLFLLNHYHYLFSERNNKRGLILSRYANLGSHRYPLGFSGDSFINFPLLKFIPYFTSTASNVGYTLWSHDIGGHMFGYKDDQLYVRWLQFGCFSPINRLHSSNMAVTGKEPWKVNGKSEKIATTFLRLRHKLIPYLYSEYRNNVDMGLPLIRPLYYHFGDNENSYKFKNEYFLGDKLLVSPITSRVDKRSFLSVEKAFIPCDNMVDIFTRKTYKKGTTYFAREIDDIPILLKKGAILPLDRSYLFTKNPLSLEIIVNVGNGEYSLYEDDGISKEYLSGNYSTASFDGLVEDDNYALSVNYSHNLSNLPKKRDYIIKPINLINAKNCSITINGEEKILNKKKDFGVTFFYDNEDCLKSFDMENEIIKSDLVVCLSELLVSQKFTLNLFGAEFLSNGKYIDNITLFLSKLNKGNISKTFIYQKLSKCSDILSAKKVISKLNLSKKNKNALYEICDFSIFSK